MLSESKRNWILQIALEKVKTGKDPEEWNAPKTEEEIASYKFNVADLQKYMDLVGPEQFSKTTFDVGYDYD